LRATEKQGGDHGAKTSPVQVGHGFYLLFVAVTSPLSAAREVPTASGSAEWLIA
jgi:hypothetical protein